jgi:hypothetical protein
VAGANSYTLDRQIKNLVLQQHAVGILTARRLQGAKIIFVTKKRCRLELVSCARSVRCAGPSGARTGTRSGLDGMLGLADWISYLLFYVINSAIIYIYIDVIY